MQAIVTKYLAPTNTRGSRYSAQCERGSIKVAANYDLNVEENHKAACDALCAKFAAEDVAKYGSKEMMWNRPKVGGCLPDGRYAFVFLPRQSSQS